MKARELREVAATMPAVVAAACILLRAAGRGRRKAPVHVFLGLTAVRLVSVDPPSSWYGRARSRHRGPDTCSLVTTPLSQPIFTLIVLIVGTPPPACVALLCCCCLLWHIEPPQISTLLLHCTRSHVSYV